MDDQKHPSWFLIQERVFIDWINHYLKDVGESVTSLETDFRDGVKLILLVEILTGATVGRYNRNARFKSQMLDNTQIAMDFIESKWNLNVVGIVPQDFFDGRLKQILGFIFLLVTKSPEKRDPTQGVPTHLAARGVVKRTFSLPQIPPPASGPSVIRVDEQHAIKRLNGSQDGLVKPPEQPLPVLQRNRSNLSKFSVALPNTFNSQNGTQRIIQTMNSVPTQQHPFTQSTSPRNISLPCPTHQPPTAIPLSQPPSPRHPIATVPGSHTPILEVDLVESQSLHRPKVSPRVVHQPKVDLATPCEPVVAPIKTTNRVSPRSSGRISPRSDRATTAPDAATREPTSSLMAITEVKEPKVPRRSVATLEAKFDDQPTLVKLEPNQLIQTVSTESIPTYKEPSRRSSSSIPALYLDSSGAEKSPKAADGQHTARNRKKDRPSPRRVTSLDSSAGDTPRERSGSTKRLSKRLEKTPRETATKSPRTGGSMKEMVVRDKESLKIAQLSPSAPPTSSGSSSTSGSSSGALSPRSKAGRIRSMIEQGSHAKLSDLIAAEGDKPVASSSSPVILNRVVDERRRESLKRTATPPLGHINKTPPGSPGGGSLDRKAYGPKRHSISIPPSPTKSFEPLEPLDMMLPMGITRNPTRRQLARSASAQPTVTRPHWPVEVEFQKKIFPFIRLQAVIRGFNIRAAYKKERWAATCDKINANPKHLTNIARLQAVLRAKNYRLHRLDPSVKAFYFRHRVAQEIVQTETFYVNCLRCLTTIYMERLRKLIPPETLKTIFSDSVVLYKYNNLILGKLQQRLASWYQEHMCIGDIFLKYIDFMKVYTPYVNNYPKAVSALSESIAADPTLADTLWQIRSDPEIGHELQSFLIMPIQRLPRYIIMLQELLKFTPSTHQDYNALSESVKRLVVVANYLNEKKHEAENISAVNFISTRIHGLKREDIISTTRTYVRQGALRSDKSDEAVPRIKLRKGLHSRYCFLFNDVIIVTKKIGSGNVFQKAFGTVVAGADSFDTSRLSHSDDTEQLEKFKFIDRYSLSGLELVELKSHHHVFGLQDLTGELIVAFEAQDLKTKVDWMQDIDELFWKTIRTERARFTTALLKTEEKNNPNPKVLKEGYLHKQGRNAAWTKKYFVLSGTSLLYYRTEADYKEDKGKVSIPILQANVILWPVSDRPFCLVVETEKQQLILSTKSGVQRMYWINTLRSGIKAHLHHLDQAHTNSNPPSPGHQALKSAGKQPLPDIVTSEPTTSTPFPKQKRHSLGFGSLRKKEKSHLRSQSHSVSPFEMAKKSNTAKMKEWKHALSGLKKSGALYKEDKDHNFHRYLVVLKGHTLTMSKSSKKEISIDLFLCSQIDLEDSTIIETKALGLSLYTFHLISATHNDTFASQSKDDLEDWVGRINKTIAFLHSF